MKTLGRTGFPVTDVCVGTSSLGNHPRHGSAAERTEAAVAAVRAALAGPFNFLDTSNEYGHDGGSERWIGQALREAGGLPEGFVLSTKVDPVVGTADYSGDRVRRSVEESLERLGLDTLPLVHLHDPEKISFEEGVGAGGPLEALVDLRDQGMIGHLGVAGGPIGLELKYLATEVFDVVISHNRYTLVDQSAEPLIEDARRRGVAFMNAAPFGGGMLVKGPDVTTNYCYRPASAEVLGRVRKMQDLCSEYAVPLAAAALQFSTRDPRITSTIVGMAEPDRVPGTARLARWSIPEEFWERVLPLAAGGNAGLVN
ncbi:aldo/keto reductase [Arthrobacter sp. AFG7.2]|uniref:aldo/keto reductase n=1 Tax=Arthrobacter sp. AFG7.2 TaxID=1688693 RepID=UPI001CB96310|nr:aldo/keto reductase [Arthrobacter sp. AFG7.2]